MVYCGLIADMPKALAIDVKCVCCCVRRNWTYDFAGTLFTSRRLRPLAKVLKGMAEIPLTPFFGLLAIASL